MPKLHASASWAVFNCPASKSESEKAAGSTCKPARDGSHIHDLIAKHFQGEEIRWPRYEDTGKEQREIKHLFDSAMVIWEELSEWFRGSPVTEYAMDSDPDITGTLDLFIFGEQNSVAIIDWKSGRVRDFDAALCQLKTYAGLWKEQKIDSVYTQKFYLYIGWLRNQEYESDPSHPFTVDQIDEHMAILRENLKPENQNNYVTGDHCQFCDGRKSCPKIGDNAMLPMKWSTGEIELVLNPENALKLKAFLPVLKRATDDAAQALRDYVEGIEADGGKVVHEGKRLTIGPSSEMKKHVAHGSNEAHETAMDYMNPADFNHAAIVPFGALKEIVMNNAPRGSKGKTVKEFEKALDDKNLIVKSSRRGSLKVERDDREEF